MALVCRCLRSLGRLKSRVPILRPTLVRWGAVGVTLFPSVAYCCNVNNNNATPTMVIDVEDDTEETPPVAPVTISEIQEIFTQTSDAAVALFRKTADALVQAENQYAKIIYRLIAFHSASAENLGDAKEEEKIMSLIIDTRLEIKEANEKRKELMLVFVSTEKLLKQVSEVAFMAGDEDASTFAYRILYDIQKEVQDAATESKMAENMLSEAQVHSIEVTGKFIEETALSKKEDPQEVTG